MWRALSRGCGYLLLTLLVSLALIQGALRWGLPRWVDSPQLKPWLTERLGLPLDYGQLHIDWAGWEPQLVVQQLTLAGQIRLQRLSLKLDLLGSLWHRQWRSHELLLSGLELRLQQTEQGWQLAGLTGSSPTRSFGELWQQLSQQQHIQIQQLRLSLHPQTGADWQLWAPDLRWEQQSEFKQLLGQATLVGPNSQTPLNLVVEQQAREPVRFYLTTDALPLARLNPYLQDVQLTGQAALRIWGRWPLQQSQPELDARLTLDQLSVQRPAQPELRLQRLQARLAWNPDWALPGQLLDIQTQDPQLDWPLLAARLGFRWQAGKLDWRLLADKVELERLAQWPVPDILPAAASGHLTSLDWQGDWSPTGPLHWQGSAGLERLELDWPGALRLSGLSGQLYGNQEQVQLDFAASPLKFDSHGLFRWPFEFDSARGGLSWQRQPDGWQLTSSQSLQLTRGEQELAADFRLERHLQQPLELSLLAGVTNADAQETPKYLPTRIMNPKLVQFLDQSIQAGRVTRAQVLLRGRLNAFPFRENQGTFLVEADLEQGRFQPPDWPVIDGIQARLRFTGDSMQIQSRQASSLGLKLKPAEVSIAQFHAHPAWLKVKGAADSDWAGGLNYLAASPLASLAERLKTLGLQGGSLSTQLDFELALDTSHQLKLQGRSQFKGLKLVSTEPAIELNQIRGQLRFSETQAEIPKLQAMLWGQPVTGSWQGSADQQQFNVETRLAVRHLSKLWPARLWEPVQGELPLSLTGSLDAQGQGKLKLDSSLQGLSLALPAPLAKTAPTATSFSLQTDLPNAQRIDIQYQRQLNLSIRRSGQTLTGLSLALNQPLPIAKPGLQIRAYLAELPLNVWRDWLLGWLGTEVSLKPTLPLTQLELATDRLLDDDLALTDASLTLLAPQADSSRFRLVSRELVGDIQMPAQKQGQWRFNLSRCYLDQQWQAPTQAFDPDAPELPLPADLDPRRIPAFWLQCQDFRWRRSALGKLEILAQPKPQGLRIERFKIDGPRLQADAQMDWAVPAMGQLSLISATLLSPDIGQLLTSFDIGSGIRRTPAKLVLDLNWRGGLHQLRLSRLNGQIALEFGEGQLEDVSDKGARLFSLLSLETLSRRLRLDFTDIFQKGFFFNSLKGDFRLKEGLAYTDNMVLDGLAARVEIRGKTDLRRRQVDQQLLVIPKPGSSLPLLAAWAINPMTGAAVFVLDRLFTPTLNLITAIQYRAVGPWDRIELQETNKQQQPLD